ncbi:MAG: sulfotransferase [Xanthomonadales bacterium]|nr:sulfotransferase [Xanthomonadales bacterium]
MNIQSAALPAARDRKVPGDTVIDRVLRLNSSFKSWRLDRRDRRLLANADAVVVSFPKSGRTWVRVMLSRLCQTAYDLPDDTLLWFAQDLAKRKAPGSPVPQILFTHDVNAMTPTHKISPDKSHYTGLPLALLSRHPADVAVSRYYHLKHRSPDPARRWLARGALQDFVWTDYGGLPAIITWLNHWAEAVCAHPEFGIFRYEDLRAQPQEYLLRLARHLSLPAKPDSVQEAVDFAAFEHLKKKEAEGFFQQSQMRPGRSGSAQSFKVRSGKVGGWRENFSGAEVAEIESLIAERLDPVFGYATEAKAEERAEDQPA